MIDDHAAVVNSNQQHNHLVESVLFMQPLSPMQEALEHVGPVVVWCSVYLIMQS
jgi:hypothetical protein